MGAEWVEVGTDAVRAIERAKAGGRIVAVGTTVVRALETAALQGMLQPYRGETSLFVRPGFQFKVVDALLTNFHLPRTTLLMLVSALAGTEFLRQAYEEAVRDRLPLLQLWRCDVGSAGPVDKVVLEQFAVDRNGKGRLKRFGVGHQRALLLLKQDVLHGSFLCRGSFARIWIPFVGA